MMKIDNNLYYVKSDRWSDFLNSYSNFRFKHEGGFAYPDYIYRIADDGKKIRINISEPCVNVWDDKDKNSQREVWLYQEGRGWGHKNVVAPYIQDLINAGYIE